MQFDYDPVNGSPTFFNNCVSYYHNNPGNVFDEPEFVNPAFGLGPNYDKPDADWSLRDNSPCINAGSTEQSCYPATDVYGNPRVNGGIIDIGAVENQNFDGIGDMDEDGIGIFPNPGNNKMIIIMLENSEISIYDITGKLVYFDNNVDVITEIDTESWNSGIYILKICGENFKTTKRWIKY